jgi:hypothetical protein
MKEYNGNARIAIKNIALSHAKFAWNLFINKKFHLTNNILVKILNVAALMNWKNVKNANLLFQAAKKINAKTVDN